MCGIIFALKNDGASATKVVRKRFDKQRGRGTQGFGYVAVKNGKVVSYNRTTDEAGIFNKLGGEDANTILFHHRFPTSTPNFEETAHPIHVSNAMLEFDYYLIHNGVISNPTELKTEHNKLGFEYITEYTEETVRRFKDSVSTFGAITKFNDSEALAVEVALFIEGIQQEINTRGSAAFVCLQTTKKGVLKRIFYGHNSGSPLIEEAIGNTKGHFILKSEGDGVSLPVDVLYERNFKSGHTTTRHVDIGKRWQYEKTHERMGYRTEPTPSRQTPLLPASRVINSEGDAEFVYELDDDDLAAYYRGEHLATKPRKARRLDFSNEGDRYTKQKRLQELETLRDELDTQIAERQRDANDAKEAALADGTPRHEYIAWMEHNKECRDAIKVLEKQVSDIEQEVDDILF